MIMKESSSKQTDNRFKLSAIKKLTAYVSFCFKCSDAKHGYRVIDFARKVLTPEA